jgi:hypothetical protein
MPVGSQVHPYPRCPNEVSAREKAVSHALADVRQEYLAYLETWREGLSESDLIGSAVLDGQIHTLRRQLGMQAEPDRDRIRELVRERARRHRERRKAVTGTLN